MLFLIELDHVKQGTVPTPETGRAFIEQIIFPTLARAEELVKAKKILAGGPVLGRVALRLIVEADSSSDVDKIITSLPIWPHADTAACRGTLGKFPEKVVTAGSSNL